MFYPEASLKKGGRFYLCWVADSWPLCFATITHRQLWAQDIRKICDDLLEVMNNESGRPGSRFSLRLSSQLMRGLVRLYQRKVIIMLGDLCMINAKVMKSSHKRLNIHEPVEDIERQLFPMLELPAIVPEVPAEPEERVEELIQQSGNVVRNIQDITLKEAAIPDFQLPPNDGFGEENANQALQFLEDRTLEQMLGASTSAVHSGLELPLAESSAADKTRESRLGVEPQMERISGHDVTVFRKSIAQDILPEELVKDISIPEIAPPDLPLPAPTVKDRPQEPELEAVPIPEPPVEAAPVVEARIEPETAAQAPVEVEIEELDELEPQAKRRRKHKLIIDKKTIIPSSFIRPRLENVAVELRCEDSSEDIADLLVPWDILSRRPAAAGARVRTSLARPLAALFQRNLGSAGPMPQREMELPLASRARTQPILEIIPEEGPQELVPQQIPDPQPEPQVPEPEQPNILDQSIAVPDLRVSAVEDIADLPTQKLERASQKRPASREEHEISARETPKRQRLSGIVSFRQQQHQFHIPETEEQQIVEKENIPDNRQIIPPHFDEQPLIPEIVIHPSSDPEKRLTTLLQEAGLADMEMRPEERVQVEEETQRKSRKHGSESSETMLGSLDRTKVSLGDSDHTTDSKRFIRDQWGTEGTMVKILRAIKAASRPLNVEALVSCGPLLPGCKRVIAARCFNSILKLKQHRFITVSKDPETLEVTDIVLGPKFDIN